MSFREVFLNKLMEKSRAQRTSQPINPDKLQAFTRKDIETAIQLYAHLKNMGNTFDDLVAFVETQRRIEQTAHVKSAVQSTIFLTREQRKHLKKGGGKRRQ